MIVFIKDWFRGKIEKPYGYEMIGFNLNVIKETEKAYYGEVEMFRVDGEYEITRNVWVPKSCTETAEEVKAREEDMTSRFNKGREYNERLVDFCKDNGIKGARIGLRTETLINKIRQAGYEVPERA